MVAAPTFASRPLTSRFIVEVYITISKVTGQVKVVLQKKKKERISSWMFSISFKLFSACFVRAVNLLSRCFHNICYLPAQGGISESTDYLNYLVFEYNYFFVTSYYKNVKKKSTNSEKLLSCSRQNSWTLQNGNSGGHWVGQMVRWVGRERESGGGGQNQFN